MYYYFDVLFSDKFTDWENMTASPSQWREEVNYELEKFQNSAKQAAEDGLYDQTPDKQREQWNIIGSLFYCVTVITTIGKIYNYSFSRGGKL